MRDRPVCVAAATTERTVPNKSEGRVDSILKVWDGSHDFEKTCKRTYPGKLLEEAEAEAQSPASAQADKDALNFGVGGCPSVADKMERSYNNWREYVSSVLIAHNRTI